MKLKSTLWALAFACAAVSCSDDLEQGGGNNENGATELEGPTTYMQVSINPSIQTKADVPNGGEEGDNLEGEVGLPSEYKVNDVTIILYRDAETDKSDGTDPKSFGPNSVLVGSGYADGLDMAVSDETWHDRQATVTVTMTDDQAEGFDGKTYGIIAVTNIGDKSLKNRVHSGDLTTGAQLANLIYKKVWNDTDGFIMSTHNDTYVVNGKSVSILDKVTLRANATPTDAPDADVHVERLAAKIRISGVDEVEDFIYTKEESNNLGAAKVRLDEVRIVNQLTSGTYLLKRVTSPEADSENEKALPTTSVGGPNGTKYDLFLGNEIATIAGAGLNYVIDPWTRVKENLAPTATNLNDRDALATEYGDGAYTLSYDNDFYPPTADGSAGTTADYAGLWQGLKGGKILSGNTTDFTSTQTTVDLCYTQENTTSAAMSKNGYSTGALFKATYFPEKWVATKMDGKGVEPVKVQYKNTEGSIVEYAKISSTTKTPTGGFYVYNNVIYKDCEAIFNEAVWGWQKELDDKVGATIYSYTDFTAEKIVSIKKAEFKAHLLANGDDPFGYIEYLKEKCADATDDYATFASTDAIETYIKNYMEGQTSNKINYYADFVCYYPYWIRHANNEKTPNMGIMEFGIVRNNIYDMSVSAINTLGLSGIDKPEPDKDDENEEYYFNVRILVKNWVVRSNTGIVL
mgnify:CR=1 FL=1